MFNGSSSSYFFYDLLMNSIADYTTTKEDLMLKESELEKSRTTLEGIAFEYQRLQTNLQKV